MFRYDVVLKTKFDGTVVGKTIIHEKRIMTKTTVEYDFDGEPTYTTVLYKFYKGRYVGVRCEFDDKSVESGVRYIIAKAIIYNEI